MAGHVGRHGLAGRWRQRGRPFVDRWDPIHPEQLLASKPEVILMAGYESVSSAVIHAAGRMCRQRPCASVCEGFAARPGWSELPAVKEVASTRSITAPPAASWMPPSSSSWPRPSIPDLFQDPRLLATYQAFYQHYLPIRPQGTFMLGIKAG